MKNASRAAIVVPRKGTGPNVPLLFYPALSASSRGAKVARLDWVLPPEVDGNSEAIGQWVVDQVEPELRTFKREMGEAVTPLLIGSSMGTRAVKLAAEYDLPAIWITPTMTRDDWVVRWLRKCRAPMLLIGGTDDKLWDGEVAREVSPHVLELQGADHMLLNANSTKESIAILAQMVSATEAFMDEVVWTETKV